MTTAVPPEPIQRVLHITPAVHIYAVPPLTTGSKGYVASQWTSRPEIFTARLRIIETATTSSLPASRATKPATSQAESEKETLSTSISLEDPKTGELFAAAPYTHPSVVTACTDSARFFAVRVQGDGGMKATLGVGFEERVEAFDFKAALGDAGRVLGFAEAQAGKANATGRPNAAEQGKRKLSLKEGEMITVNIGGQATPKVALAGGNAGAGDPALFPISPPPPPPATAAELKEQGGIDIPPPPPGPGALVDGTNDTSTTEKSALSEEAEDDDGDFGDFQ